MAAVLVVAGVAVVAGLVEDQPLAVVAAVLLGALGLLLVELLQVLGLA